MRETYTLDAIPDEHPDDHVSNLIISSELAQDEKVRLAISISTLYRGVPLHVITNSDFWREIEGSVLQGRENDVGWRLVVYKHLKQAQLTLEHHIGVLASGDYNRLYHEGPKPTLFSAYAQARGVEVVHLDQENVFYNALLLLDRKGNDWDFFSERGTRLHKKREGVWMSRIDFPPRRSDLLTLGKRHLENCFGFQDAMREKKVLLRSIPVDYQKLEERSHDYAIERMMREK